MADGPCGEEAPSSIEQLGTVNRVVLPGDRHKCSSSSSSGSVSSKSKKTSIASDVGIINIEKEPAISGGRVVNSLDAFNSRVACLDDDSNNINNDNNKNNNIQSKNSDRVAYLGIVDADLYRDHTDDDEDDDEDEDEDDDEEDDDDGDDEDDVSSSSIISGCVSDDVLIGSTTTTVNKSGKKPSVEKETVAAMVQQPSVVVVNVRKTLTLTDDVGRTASSLLGEISAGLIVTEPKRGAAVKTVDINDNSKTSTAVNSFKGQIRPAEDTLVGPCGKKRCVDRYDSSESSDSGVAVSCSECSSSGTSDITEPGSPCSTSSDEGLAGIRSSAPSPPHKLAPPTPPPSRGPQWPWTPPLAATACSTLKKIKGEPEAGTLPKAGAADPTNCRGKSQHHHHHHHHHLESGNGGITSSTQGKITEYFKTQIKPQQVKVKKSLDMSLLVAKSSPEFRRPPTVQRNKVGLAKYLGTVPPHSRPSDWEVRTLTMSPPPMKNPPVVVPRTHSKIDKLQSPVPSLPISSNVLSSLPAVKLSSLRLPSDVSPDPKIVAPSTPATPLLTEDKTDLRFGEEIFAKPAVNENNNLTSTIIQNRSIQNDHISRLPSVPEDDQIQAEQELKQPLSPILSAPTTIRFPAQAPGKNRPQTADSGICRWDQCDSRFDSSGGLLEHLQVSHINTQTGGDNFICHWQGCKVQGRTSCSRRWLERHVLSHGGNKPFRCIVDGCGSRFSSQITLERHVNGHFNQPETSSSSGRKSCENGGKLVRRNGKRLRYRRQPWSARLFDFIDTGVMEGLQHRLLELARSRTQGRLAETPGDSMALTSQVLARRVENDGKTKVLLRWYPQDIAPDEWVLESEVQETKHVRICDAAASSPDEVNLALYPAMNSGSPPQTRTKQRRKPIKNS